jgi:VWFA-related protein
MLKLISGFSCSFLLCMGMLLVNCGSTAQETKLEKVPAPPYTINVKSRLVTLDVVVTDRAGRLRNDLTVNDFQITEDGVRQTITSFESPSEHTLPVGRSIESTGDLDRIAPQSPVDIVVLDELNTGFQDMAFARYALKKYLNAQPAQFQAPTILIAVSHERLVVLRDYTENRGAILSALDHHLAAYPWRLQTGVSVIEQLALSLGALEQVAQATAGHPGHKNLIWIGHGFPGINLSSPGIDSNSARGITTAVQQAVNMLRDSRITLYTFDPTALTSSLVIRTDSNSVLGAVEDASGLDPFDGDIHFTALATATGGKAFYSRNDVDREIDESVRDGVNYYTISYRPNNDSDADRPYRRVRVSLTVPGLHAGYRDGYYTRDEAQPMANTKRVKYDMDAAEENTLVYTGLSIIADSKAANPGTYLVRIPERELVWSRGGDVESAKLTLVAVEIDAKDRILRRVTNEVTARRPLARPAGETDAGFARLEISLPPAAGAVRVRFVVRSDSDGRVGTADHVVDR